MVYKKLSSSALGDNTLKLLPMPGRFVIGSDGIIAYAEVNPDYTRRPEPSDMLPAIRRACLAVLAA